ncbi:replication protein A 70 kDa DNA-binding subunit C-like [Phragmites australis]|uniref:replication protein A 70 kDa DNA-binding subunit C-like n=1 Tax=Phragmites australis TaxID=29695 RepID=UPI002D767967|nr:replication protein A 70 kDa DNA-binding subunit C-like [Phragmites australis]
MSICMLKDIHPRGRHWTVCTRVSRMWDYRGGTDDDDIRHLDLVLLDAEGTAIYAEIGSDNVKDKKPLLAEGNIYMFKRFRVLNSKSSYRPVDSEYMIQITCHTLIEESNAFQTDFPLYTYNLTKFPDLPALVGETKYFVDVIGLITEVTDPVTVQLHNQSKPTVRRAITLRDTSNYEIKLYLWGQRASEFNASEIYAIGQGAPVIAIFVGTLMKSYKGEHSLSGNAACRWYINPAVPEAHAVLDRLRGTFQPVQHVSPDEHTAALQPVTIEAQEKTLEDMFKISPYDFPPEGFRCTITVSRVDPFLSWCFPSCNRCSRAALPDSAGYKCPHCKCTGSKFKYRICFMGTDGTDEAEFVLFGDMGRRLVHKDVKVLMRSCRSADGIPSEIASLVSQKYHFTVNVSSKSFEKPQRSYEVKDIHCAYGRQTTIPVIRKSGTTSTNAKRKALLPIADSSSLLKPHKEQEVQVAALPQNVKDTPPPKDPPSSTPLQTSQPSTGHPTDSGGARDTPPRKDSPSSAPLQTRKSSSTHPANDAPARNTRRRLLMSGESTDEGFDKHHDPLNDELGHNLDDATARSLPPPHGDGRSSAHGADGST